MHAMYMLLFEYTQHSVDLLVLDRTFSSLSAAAQRLIGGWTKVSRWQPSKSIQ
jgi:hypothetical protein